MVTIRPPWSRQLEGTSFAFTPGNDRAGPDGRSEQDHLRRVDQRRPVERSLGADHPVLPGGLERSRWPNYPLSPRLGCWTLTHRPETGPVVKSVTVSRFHPAAIQACRRVAGS